MGLNHKIAWRLFSNNERKRRLFALEMHQPKLMAEKFKPKLNQKSSSRKSLTIGLALILHLGCFLVHMRIIPGGNTSMLTTVALFLSFISIVRLLNWLDQNTPMAFEGRTSFSQLQWRKIIETLYLRTKRRLLKLEQTYLKMRNFALLVNQLVFFSLCERAFLVQRQPITSFYTLMFYNVIAYCISYIKELIQREDWSIFIKVAKGSNMRHLGMSVTNIVLEWTKAVAFIITIVFILLVCGLEKGLKDYTPNAPYLLATGLYFMLSEKVFAELIFLAFEGLKFDCFESMEKLYSPIILKGIQIFLSLTMTIACGMLGYVRITSLAAFTNVRSKYKELDNDHWQPLRRELVKLIGFRSANRDEIRQHDDVCAVCLTPMTSARITPCSHFFHAECLRRCLTEASLSCPICKHHLSFKCANYFANAT